MALPKGMTKIVREAWPRIDEAVTEALSRVEHTSGGGALDEVDPDTDMYGCGFWGCAYPTASSRWAVKVSADPFEGPIVYAVMNSDLRNHPSCAYILDMWKLAEKARSNRTIWVILREDINPLPIEGHVSKWVSRVINDLHHVRLTAAEANRRDAALEDKGHGYGRTRKAREARKDWERAMGRLEDTQPSLADFMWSFYDDFGARLADIHGGNVGLRTHALTGSMPHHKPAHELVAFDLGHSDVEVDDGEVPLLPNPFRIKVI